MGWFDFGLNDETKMPGTTVNGFLSSEDQVLERLKYVGQTHDSVTGIDARDGIEAYRKGKASGMSASELSDLVDRIIY